MVAVAGAVVGSIVLSGGGLKEPVEINFPPSTPVVKNITESQPSAVNTFAQANLESSSVQRLLRDSSKSNLETPKKITSNPNQEFENIENYRTLNKSSLIVQTGSGTLLELSRPDKTEIIRVRNPGAGEGSVPLDRVPEMERRERGCSSRGKSEN